LKNLEEPNENKHEKKRNQFNEKHTNTDNNEKPKQEKTNLNNENTNKEKNKETEKTYDTNQDKSERYREKEKTMRKGKKTILKNIITMEKIEEKIIGDITNKDIVIIREEINTEGGIIMFRKEEEVEIGVNIKILIYSNQRNSLKKKKRWQK